MDKKKLLIGSGVILAGIAGYMFIKNRKKKQALLPDSNIPVNQSTNGENVNQVQIYKPVSEFPLQFGSRGENVKKLQTYLNQKINAGLVVDGIFGDKTAEAVKRAIGSTQVSEAMFKQYIGAPALQSSAKNTLFTALSTINPVFKFFK